MSGRDLPIHLPRSADEAGVAHGHANMIHTLPLTPGFLGALTILHKVASPPLLVGLTIKNETNSDGVPQSPNNRVEDEECLPTPA